MHTLNSLPCSISLPYCTTTQCMYIHILCYICLLAQGQVVTLYKYYCTYYWNLYHQQKFQMQVVQVTLVNPLQALINPL